MLLFDNNKCNAIAVIDQARNMYQYTVLFSKHSDLGLSSNIVGNNQHNKRKNEKTKI